MKRIHKIASGFIVVMVSFLAFVFRVRMTESMAQSFLTFLCLVFGFYLACVAILYGSRYAKRLHGTIDERGGMRGTHRLGVYLRVSGCVCLGAIVMLLGFVTIESRGKGVSEGLDWGLCVSSCIFGLIVLTVFYMLLLLNTILDGLIEEAKS